MKLISGLVWSGAVAFGVAAAALAQDTARPPGQAGGRPGGDGNAERAASVGGAYGVITGVSAKSFAMSTTSDRPVTVELAAATTYRMGKAPATARAIKVGDRVRVLGTVDYQTTAPSVIKAAQVVLQPVEGAGTEMSIKVSTAVVAVLAPVLNNPGAPGAPGPRAAGPGQGAAGPAQGAGGQAQAVPARHIGQISADWTDAGDPASKVITGPEANRAIEVGMATPWSAGGIVNRIVRERDGTLQVHNVGTHWPHHIFLTADFKPIGAD
jgi:hypothetical protein